MKKIRVLVVEDSLTVRKYLVECLNADPELEVVAEAADGKQAIELCERLRPDVVTLDMMMPVMTGLSATEYIMAYCPTPIVIVSASTNRGELFRTYDALAAGALDVIEKPRADADEPAWARKLVSTVKLAARVKVITHLRAKLNRPTPGARRASADPAEAGSADPAQAARHQYVAIGASTGGPQALARILGALPADYPLPILIVMHISPTFAGAFADWLHDQAALPVVMAGHDQPLPRFGTPGAVLAPADRHLVVRGERLELTSDAEVHSCRPSVDVLFASVAAQLGSRAVGVLLTGMGRDGAAGLLEIRNAGGLTLAQDEATCTIFGMPREAIQLGAAQRVIPLEQIAPALTALVQTGEAERRRA